jgi:hypothetical protein
MLMAARSAPAVTEGMQMHVRQLEDTLRRESDARLRAEVAAQSNETWLERLHARLVRDAQAGGPLVLQIMAGAWRCCRVAAVSLT